MPPVCDHMVLHILRESDSTKGSLYIFCRPADIRFTNSVHHTCQGTLLSFPWHPWLSMKLVSLVTLPLACLPNLMAQSSCWFGSSQINSYPSTPTVRSWWVEWVVMSACHCPAWWKSDIFEQQSQGYDCTFICWVGLAVTWSDVACTWITFSGLCRVCLLSNSYISLNFPSVISVATSLSFQLKQSPCVYFVQIRVLDLCSTVGMLSLTGRSLQAQRPQSSTNQSIATRQDPQHKP